MRNEQQTGSTRIEIISEIIRDSYALRNVRMPDPARLAEQVAAWMKRVDGIPTAQLMPAYDRIAASLKHALTPQDLLDSYRELKFDEARRQSRKPEPVDESCGACFGVGYQVVRDGHYTSSRPCACSAAPASQRSKEPLSPANGWQLRGREWVRAEQKPREYHIRPQQKSAQVQSSVMKPAGEVLDYRRSLKPRGKDGEEIPF